MAGAHVFPGGRLDEGDRELARSLPETALAHAAHILDATLAPEEAASYAVAAIRETAEEAGMLLAVDDASTEAPSGTPLGSSAVLERCRRAQGDIQKGARFAEALGKEHLLPDVTALGSCAWWITPEVEPKRFDTRFFFASAPPGFDVAIDDHEVTEFAWLTPEAALALHREGRLLLAPPTFVLLEDLTGARALDDVSAQVARPIPAICPTIVLGDPIVLALPGDPLHTDPRPVFPHRTRIVVSPERTLRSAAVTR
jgi:8-oxo-dGTP pyrophosphatase MutT (NUDIX family)